MPRSAFYGLPHSESEVYYGKLSAIERKLPVYMEPDASAWRLIRQ